MDTIANDTEREALIAIVEAAASLRSLIGALPVDFAERLESADVFDSMRLVRELRSVEIIGCHVLSPESRDAADVAYRGQQVF